ncbi:MAG TPA: ABC transporter ATP-binding protein [Candidatus Bathyarchaeia archaeon]|nr:ABC transporter ATP-binding protein [Candidatus Bathyarchaeia archaeon]
MIEIASLTKTFGRVEALRRVDLSIGRGMFGLLGPNGAGKTTLMRILAGIVQPTAGTVRVGGSDHATDAGKRATKSILGYLPQELGMYPELTAEQLVDYMAILKGIDDGRLRRKRVEDVLEMVALSAVATRKIRTFSGGMKRRVGIAQALVNDPKLLIVDEPTAGLDPEERIRFRNLLVRLAGERTVLLSTHIVEDIGQTCRDLAVLGKGRILFRGSPADLAGVAEGHVWSLVTPRVEEPAEGTTIVSMLHLADGVQLRVVGPRPGPQAAPAAPSLEDGYVRLMQGARG